MNNVIDMVPRIHAHWEQERDYYQERLEEAFTMLGRLGLQMSGQLQFEFRPPAAPASLSSVAGE